MNTQSKHTPGPWHAALGLKLISDVYAVGVNGQRVFIAECATQRDALLIAAAPAMYEALKAIVGQQPPNRWGYDSAGIALDDEWRAQARTALAQAEGRAL